MPDTDQTYEAPAVEELDVSQVPLETAAGVGGSNA